MGAKIIKLQLALLFMSCLACDDSSGSDDSSKTYCWECKMTVTTSVPVAGYPQTTTYTVCDFTTNAIRSYEQSSSQSAPIPGGTATTKVTCTKK